MKREDIYSFDIFAVFYVLFCWDLSQLLMSGCRLSSKKCYVKQKVQPNIANCNKNPHDWTMLLWWLVCVLSLCWNAGCLCSGKKSCSCVFLLFVGPKKIWEIPTWTRWHTSIRTATNSTHMTRNTGTLKSSKTIHFKRKLTLASLTPSAIKKYWYFLFHNGTRYSYNQSLLIPRPISIHY